MLNTILKERAVYHNKVISIATQQMRIHAAGSINHSIAESNLRNAKAILAELIIIENMSSLVSFLAK